MLFSNAIEMVSHSSSVNWDKLRNSTVLVTGGTGLIGTTLVNGLAIANRKRELNLKILCLVRNLEKAKKRLDSDVRLCVGDFKNLPSDDSIDYIIHGANPTASSFFVDCPVETIGVAVEGTTHLLEFAREKLVKGFVFLSSMEVYGSAEKGQLITEEHVAGFDSMIVRNSYPQSKLICEALCKAYQSEYDVPAMVVRLTQTFGPGVEYYDRRVFAEFMRCAIEKKNIVLHTEGKTERCYLYTGDAATAILTVLTKGNPGEAYTVANKNTYCSIREMAEMVAREVAGGKIQVDVEIDGVNRGYAPETYMKLDTRKIESLGWIPTTGLKEMFLDMIDKAEFG